MLCKYGNCVQLVLPEYLLHGLCVFLFMLASEWLSFIINAPLLAYHINRYVVLGPYDFCEFSTLF